MNDIELSIIGTFLSGTIAGDTCRKLVEVNRLKPEFFKDNSARMAFEKVLSLETNDVGIIRREVSAAVGLEYAEKACENAPTNIVDADKIFRDFANAVQRERIRDVFEREIRFAGGKTTPSFLANSLRGALDRLETDFPRDATLDGMRLADFSAPIPEEDNPDSLFRGGWFRKGQAMFLVSTSGSGKSVITMQLCYGWALGRAVLGTTPVRPMKIGIFQTEDDEEELKEFRDSMRRGYRRIHGWTDADLRAAEKSICFFDPKGKMGDEFLTFVRAVQNRHHFDLIVINPLQGVTGFDLAKNENLTNFLRNGLDSIIKGEKTKCGLFVVHHTNKPPNAQERVKFGRDQFAQYIGAGGAELNNWMRGMNIILPGDEPHLYRFVAAKRGDRLNWVTPPHIKAVLPTKILAHSEPDPDGRRLLFWLDKTDELANAKAAAEAATEATPEEDAKTMVEKLKGQRLGATELVNACRIVLKRKHGDAARDYIAENAQKLGVIVEKGGNNNQRWYVFPG